MKIRSGFVSNSSSSSFIVNRDLSEFGVNCVRLTPEMLATVLKYRDKSDDDSSDDFINICKKQSDMQFDSGWYLTQFVSDCVDTHSDIYFGGQLPSDNYYDQSLKEDSPIFQKYPDFVSIYYCDGSLSCEPYGGDDEIEQIWEILGDKEHYYPVYMRIADYND